MSNEISQAEFARQNEWSRSYVTQLKGDGRLVMRADGKRVLVTESLQRIKATEDPNREDVKKRHAEGRNEEKSEESTVEQADYQRARALKEHFNALSAKAEYEKSIGKLVDAEIVQKAGFELGTQLRSAFDNLQDRLSAELAAETDIERIYALLGESFEVVLDDISQNIGSMAIES